MIARLILLFLFLASMAGAYLFLLNGREKRAVRTFAIRCAIAAFVGAAVLACLYIADKI